MSPASNSMFPFAVALVAVFGLAALERGRAFCPKLVEAVKVIKRHSVKMLVFFIENRFL